jgi:hypothetical protein
MLVRRDAGAWEAAEPVGFATEREFQDLVQETFDGILATQSDAPAVLAREVVMPDGGKIDVLAIDADGAISVLECKLASNAGIRREVLGQILEYSGSLHGMSLREFRTRVEARLDQALTDAMAERAPEDWDQEVWLEEIRAQLDSGRFRLIITVDQIAPTLKQTVRYLNSHSGLALMAVELRRARRDGVEVLVPTVFGEEQARRNVAPPSATTTVENADTVIVAATVAIQDFARTGAYICQPKRSFRDGVEYLGFYAHRRIEPYFPKILGFRPNLAFSPETTKALKSSGDPVDAQAAAVMEQELEYSDSLRTPGELYQVVILDREHGLELKQPIRHEGAAAWLRGQRYTRSDALKKQPATTEELDILVNQEG